MTTKKLLHLCMMVEMVLLPSHLMADPVVDSTSPTIGLHHLFQNHMVIQRDVKIPIFGWAGAGEEISVTFHGQTRKTKVDTNGRWRVELNPETAGGPFELRVQDSKTAVIVNDVLVGDVWLCAGQSNMERGMQSDGESKDITEANFPNLRIFQVADVAAYQPKEDVQGTWSVVTPESVAAFSAVGFYFGRNIQRSLNIPVGLIQATEGGTRIQSWIYHEILTANPRFKTEIDNWQKELALFPDYLTRFDEYSKQWQKDVAHYIEQLAIYTDAVKRAKADGKPEPPQPILANSPFSPRKNPSMLYAGIIAPLTGFPIKGVLWYQGEGNVGEPYRELLETMIQAWRTEWKSPTMPFLIVQLPRCGPVATQPDVSAPWALLREEQMQTFKNGLNLGISINIDLGDENIHPRPKGPYGERLALIARQIIYGEKIESCGPIFREMVIEGDKIRIRFDHIGGGLIVPQEPLKGFVIAGEDGKFTWADAKIDGDSVVVWSASVPTPKKVRYAYANHPICNLFNKEGLPAAPFRTDSPAK